MLDADIYLQASHHLYRPALAPIGSRLVQFNVSQSVIIIRHDIMAASSLQLRPTSGGHLASEEK